VDAGSGWPGERRLSTGLSASSGALAESFDGALVEAEGLGDETLVVESVPGAGVLEGVGAGLESP
jgi:hypothetical protein